MLERILKTCALVLVPLALASGVYADERETCHRVPKRVHRKVIRQAPRTIDYLIIHCTEGPSAQSAIGALQDRGLSIHYIIERDGRVLKETPEGKVAYHAGNSRISNMNARSIGIELVNWGEVYKKKNGYYVTPKLIKYNPEKYGDPVSGRNKLWAPYTKEQMESLAALTIDICQRNKIPTDRKHVLGHEDVADKQDPGAAFNWPWYIKEITKTS
ncbi:N-acetylmuramoyl-L-alanine amidase [Candidatus Woesearchaeota archaeon]|nr:N-acetylmuramoyl-L-alanine amidase [Candidatus Woesearchaeota archaeon]